MIQTQFPLTNSANESLQVPVRQTVSSQVSQFNIPLILLYESAHKRHISPDR